MMHWHLDEKTGIINADIYKGKLDKYVATVNLRAFYMELRETLYDKNFIDSIGEDDGKKEGIFFNEQASRGEFVENKLHFNRSADIYEKRFMWSKKPDGTVEFEMIWEVRYKTPNSDFGWLEVRINLVCRRIVNKEILDGNAKKVLQQGTWEFRNEYIYKNKVVKDYLNKVPIVKNSPYLKKMYLDHIYNHILYEDVRFSETWVIPIVQNIVHKYFSDNRQLPWKDVKDF